ncbi:MAG: hypothetical protein HDT12_01645 [Helicobacter sp.]|nr:hypothetical protein [Helicobacter sp.]MBD5166470.1 hypothetical protein [Helicobacter sp.]
MDITIESLGKIAEHFTIVHHIPGRIRLRATGSIATDANQALRHDLLQAMRQIPFIIDFKLNALIGSLTLRYDTSRFEPALWEAWLRKERLDEILFCFQIPKEQQ